MKHIIEDIPIYWINLERSPKRREYMEKLLDNEEIINKRIEAIDGNLISEKIIQESNSKNLLKRDLTRYEIACALSHIKAIQQAYDDGLEYVIIAEDDISFDYTENLTKSVKELIQNTKTLIQLIFFIKGIKQKIKMAQKYKNNDFYSHKNYWCAAFYVIHRDYMEEVLARAHQVISVADDCERNFIFSNKTFCTNIPYVGLSFLQNNSNINDKRTETNNMYMEGWYYANK